VQATLEEAIASLRGGRPVELTVAGRTDRGVHAWAQVASYPDDPVRVEGLNALLPDDVAALACEVAPDGFDARRDATSRTYCYRVLPRRRPSVFEHRRALRWPGPIDRAALDACAAALVGTHDFTAFTPTETEHVRFTRDVFEARWVDNGELLEFWIRADSFMRHMNRVLVGTMLEVAGGRRSIGSFVDLLQGRPRVAAGPTAPPHGLYFAAVGFGERPPRRLTSQRGAPAPVPVEEDDEGQDGQDEQDRVHDGPAGDGDDQQHDPQDEPQH
jgi:tRNA pseudouridine38-40 synthase